MSQSPPAEITGLYRYPVKGLTPEPLKKVALQVGRTLPADRRYAIENGVSGFDPAAPSWMPKTVFLMLMRNERLAGLRSLFEDETNILTIRRGDEIVARGDLETAEGRAAIEGFFTQNFAAGLKGPPKVLSSDGTVFPMSPKRWCRSSISKACARSRAWSATPSITCASAPISISGDGRPGTRPLSSAGRLRSARRGSG